VISRAGAGERLKGVKLPPFQALLDDHGADVHRMLRAMVGQNDADDCWQETFLAALRAYPGLTSAENLRGWLMTIAHRKALDAFRSRKRHPVPVSDPPEREAPEAPEQEPELWTAVRRLPVKQRTAVTLRFAGDLSYMQIGEIIGCSEAAARQNVRAGLAGVRREWVR
jgi:RNA polymerase sigma factor (sigma-70 family)